MKHKLYHIDFKKLPAQRLKEWKAQGKRRLCGPYVWEIKAGEQRACYLESDFWPELRWDWCDHVAYIQHKGWFFGSDCVDTFRGLVIRLNHGRGFLTGCSMGEGMITFIDPERYDDEVSAAYAADSMAHNFAELQERCDE